MYYVFMCIFIMYVLRMYIRIYVNVYIDKKNGSEAKPTDTQATYQSLEGNVAVRKSLRF